MKIYASKERRKSPDPITAYRARIEVGIYDMLLDLIIKELQAETEPLAPTLEAAPIGPTVQTA